MNPQVLNHVRIMTNRMRWECMIGIFQFSRNSLYIFKSCVKIQELGGIRSLRREELKFFIEHFFTNKNHFEGGSKKKRGKFFFYVNLDHQNTPNTIKINGAIDMN